MASIRVEVDQEFQYKNPKRWWTRSNGEIKFPPMTTSATWTPIEAPIGEILGRYPEPLLALAHNEVPAFVLRQHYNSAHCRTLMQRFYQRGLLYDPHQTGAGASRVDIGTSFGRHRADREAFHAHSAETLTLFETFFDGYDDPVLSMYDVLQELAPSK